MKEYQQIFLIFSNTLQTFFYLSTFIAFESLQKTLEFRIRDISINEVVGIRYETGKKLQRQDI